MTTPAYSAELIVAALNINNLNDLQMLQEIAFQRHAIIRYKRLKTAEARLVIGHPYSIIVISTAIKETSRRRFSIAHELGHLELHRFKAAYPCSTDDISDWASEKARQSLEQEANEFAAALLMPERLFAPSCLETEPSMRVIQRLAEQFIVSLTAASRRYVHCCYEPVAVVWTQRQQIKWFQRNAAFADFGFFINVNSLVDEATVAGRYFAGEGLPETPRLVEAAAWMSPGGFNNRLIQEQCLAVPRYEGVLSLLWVDEEWVDDPRQSYA